MKYLEKRRNEGHAAILKALAHPSRLLIVKKLSEKHYCVCELTAILGADTSTVSKNLSILQNAGIVTDCEQGTSIYCSLEAPRISERVDHVEQEGLSVKRGEASQWR